MRAGVRARASRRASRPTPAPTSILSVGPPGGAAERVDRATGVVERAGFLPGPAGLLFGTTTVPAAPPSLGVVVCPPMLSDADANYRREVVLARALGASGVAVQRLQYRGTGNSAGDPAATTFAGLCDDVRAAAAHLRAQTGVDRLVLVGTRLGAVVAATVAADYGDGDGDGGVGVGVGVAGIALWEPVSEPKRWFREAFRASTMNQIRTTSGPATDAAAELAEGRAVHALGYRVDPALHRSASATTLSGALDGTTAPVLVVQLGGGPALRAPLAKLVDHLGTRASSVVVDCDEPWWFSVPVELPERPVVDPTLAWVHRLATRGGTPA